MKKIKINAFFLILLGFTLNNVKANTLSEEKEIKILNKLNYEIINHKENIKKIKERLNNENEKINGKDEEFNIRPLENSGLYIIKLKNGSDLYTTSDGKYMIKGLALKFTENGLSQIKDDNILNISNIIGLYPKENLIQYKSNNEKYEIFVFMDYTCPYCKKLHNLTIPKIVEEGVTVNYLPYSRVSSDKKVIDNLKNIFCLNSMEDKKNEISKAFEIPSSYEIKNIEDCKNSEYMDKVINLGYYLNLKGSPSIFLKNGKLLGGYSTKEKLMEAIKEN